jgi:hypothetical protein
MANAGAHSCSLIFSLTETKKLQLKGDLVMGRMTITPYLPILIRTIASAS